MPWTEKLIEKLRDREYRGAYVEEGVKTWIARQIRALRERRKWSQGNLGEKADKPQSAISRLEDPDYGQFSLQTLFDIAKAFDVGLIVKFVDYPTFLRETKDVSTNNMQVDSFDVQAFCDFSGNKNIISISNAVSASGPFQSTESNIRQIQIAEPDVIGTGSMLAPIKVSAVHQTGVIGHG